MAPAFVQHKVVAPLATHHLHRSIQSILEMAALL